MPGSQTTRGGADPRACGSAPVAFCCHDGIGTPDRGAFHPLESAAFHGAHPKQPFVVSRRATSDAESSRWK
jgi:hypothetical protein